MTRLKKLRLLEFLTVGVIMGVAEDLLAVNFATDAEVSLRIILIVLAVAVPFAVVSELIVDHPRFWDKIFPGRKK